MSSMQSVLGNRRQLVCHSSFINTEPRGINETLLKAEITVALNLLTSDLSDRLLTSDLQTVLPKLTPSLAFSAYSSASRYTPASTLPVTSSLCERSFSAMKLLKMI